MSEQFDTKYFRGQGRVYMGLRDASGNPAGLLFIGDLGEATLTPQIETAEMIENTTGTSSVGNSFTKSIEYQFSMTMRSIKTDHLSLALQGEATKKTAGSVTDEALKGYVGKISPLKNNKVNGVVVTNAAATVTYTETSDYIVHDDNGVIEIVSGGLITEAQDLLVDYSYAAQDHILVAPSNKQHYIMFAGINGAEDSKQMRCEIYKAKLDPGVLSWIQQEQAEMQITGRVQLDSLRPLGDQLYSWKNEQ